MSFSQIDGQSTDPREMGLHNMNLQKGRSGGGGLAASPLIKSAIWR